MARKRNYPVTVWLDEKEFMFLKDKVSKTNFYRSDYIRRCSLGKNITVVPGIIKFFEMLKESGAGISVGTGDDDFGPGFGFKAEKTKIGPGGREGTIKEQSDLFGKKYQYNFSYEKIRNEIEEIAGRFGYIVTIVLTEIGL